MKKPFISLKLECQSGVRTRDLRLSKQAAWTSAPGPRPIASRSDPVNTVHWPVLDWCWPTVYDAGPTSVQHWSMFRVYHTGMTLLSRDQWAANTRHSAWSNADPSSTMLAQQCFKIGWASHVCGVGRWPTRDDRTLLVNRLMLDASLARYQPFQAWIYHCHLHPLQAVNCCRNSRLVVNDYDLKWVGNWRKLPCIGKPVS